MTERRSGEAGGQHAGGWTGTAADLEEVLRWSADPITVQDASGRVVYANEAAARQVGFATAAQFLAAPTEDILSRFSLIDESGAPMAADALPGRRALHGEAEPAALVGFRVAGEHRARWARVHARAVAGPAGVRFVVNAFQDVTGLKRTQERLRLLADAGATLAASPDYQSTLQVPQLAEWCVVDVVEEGRQSRVAVAHPDPQMRAMAEELQRRYPAAPDRLEGIARVISTGEPEIVEEITDAVLVATARDDEHLDALRRLELSSIAIVPLIARGEVLGAIALAGARGGHRYSRDDLPFLEDLATRAAVAIDNARLLHRANEAIRLRDDFLAMASHDMRTPLQAILGNLQLALRRIGDAEPLDAALAPVVRNLAAAERTTGKVARLVAELMDVAMLRSGQTLPMDMAEFDLVAVALQVAGEQAALSGQHVIRVEGEPELHGRWDMGRVERVLDNLVANAVKYSPGGGDIVIVVQREPSRAVVEVIDHGIGIPATELPHIFDPYRRGSNASTMRGIGLGLAGSRAVLEQLGGTLEAESVEGSGSVFRLALPLG